jgi:hypothetical protein
MLDDLVDIVCLVYHEARYARRPIGAGLVPDAARFAALQMLPINRDKAWQSMRPLRRAGRQATAPTGVSAVFETQYGVSVGDLAELFARPIWKRAGRVAGPAWAAIARAVEHGLEQHQQGDEEGCASTFASILAMRHNSGSVAQKLSMLRAADAD